MDTKSLENVGETFIISRLLDSGILVAKPFFDKLGTDLIGFSSIDEKTKFCRIQCKYRELKKTTSIQIDSKYIIGAFVLFLYVKHWGERHLFCFLPKDIKRVFTQKTVKERIYYRLNITKKSLIDLENDDSVNYTNEKATDIFSLLKSSSNNAELKRMISGIVLKSKEISDSRNNIMKLKKALNEIQLLQGKKEASKEKLKQLKKQLTILRKG